MELAIRVTFSIVVGYLMGSLSPAYILGKILKGLDIRTMNFRAAGARNIKAALGAWPAAVTVTVDTLKGIAVLVVAKDVIGLPPVWFALPVTAALVGHIFPFYIGFRGGKGSATAIDIFIYLMGLSAFLFALSVDAAIQHGIFRPQADGAVFGAERKR